MELCSGPNIFAPSFFKDVAVGEKLTQEHQILLHIGKEIEQGKALPKGLRTERQEERTTKSIMPLGESCKLPFCVKAKLR